MQSVTSMFKEKLYQERRVKFITAKMKIIRQLNQQQRNQYKQQNNSSSIIQTEDEIEKKTKKIITKTIEYTLVDMQKTIVKEKNQKNKNSDDFNNHSLNTAFTIVRKTKESEIVNRLVGRIITTVNSYIQSAVSTIDKRKQLNIDCDLMFEQLAELFRQLVHTYAQSFQILQQNVTNPHSKLTQYISRISSMANQLCHNQQFCIIHQQQQQPLKQKPSQYSQYNQIASNNSQSILKKSQYRRGFLVSQIYVYFITAYIEQYLLVLYQHNMHRNINITCLQITIDTLYSILLLYASVFDPLIYCQLLAIYTIAPMLLNSNSQTSNRDDIHYNNYSYQNRIDIMIYQLLIQLLQLLQSNPEYHTNHENKTHFNEQIQLMFQATSRLPSLKQASIQYLLIVCILNHMHIGLLEQYTSMGYFHKIINATHQVGDEYWALSNIIIQRLRKESINKEMLIAVEKIYQTVEKQKKQLDDDIDN